jgi:hypothetical protein
MKKISLSRNELKFPHHQSYGSIPPCFCCCFSRLFVICCCDGSHGVAFIALGHFHKRVTLARFAAQSLSSIKDLRFEQRTSFDHRFTASQVATIESSGNESCLH